METSPSEECRWSVEKQCSLQKQLVGMWSEDVWILKNPTGGTQYFRFLLTSTSLNTELKYAYWYKFDSGQWTWKEGGDQTRIRCFLNTFVQWLNAVLTHEHISSFMERKMDYWESSLRSYLVEKKQLKLRTVGPFLRANQEYIRYQSEDRHILLLHQIYNILCEAYDDRPDTEKDIWDMRKMGYAVNLTVSNSRLNFTHIHQLWLRSVAKEFMKYHITTHSTADCVTKLWSIHTFSRFLAQFAPDCRLQDICRPLIVAYMGSSWYQKGSTDRQILLLGSLRVFLETSAHYLNCEGMCKEQIIFNEDFPRSIEKVSREIPEEVLFQLRSHLPSLPTAILRMVMILLAVGMRISELCLLSTDCLICDDRHEWYLRFYQSKGHQEHVVPLVEEEVIGAIQAQQQEIRDRWGTTCPYLFPSSHSPLKPYKQMTFRRKLNQWAIEHEIKDRNGKLYHFTAHPFRHTVGMRLLNEDVPLEVISRLLGHRSLSMTQVYARIRDSKMRMELERAARNHKTVDYQGNVVKGDAQANTPEVQMTRKGVRGQTLPVGGCGRMIVLGDCSHANKCLTCPMWLTSTDDVPALKSFHERAMRLKQRAIERGNQLVVQQQDHIIPILEVRIKSLEIPEMDGSLCVDDVLAQLCSDLTEAESGLEEARVAGLVLAARHLERAITEIKARIVALEGSA